VREAFANSASDPQGGLFAAGNTAANICGWVHPGGSLDNGLVIGVVGGRDVVHQSARDV
jgi:hypothetical protein